MFDTLKGVPEAVPASPDEKPALEPVYIVLCASGFDHVPRARSALMFAGLAAAANFRTVLYCIQDAVEIMVKGAIAGREKPEPGVPSLASRLKETMEMGVEIQCCTQTMANKNIHAEDLIEGVTAAGAMNLIHLSTLSKGTICF